ncbi:MAG: 4-hydroxythreonine-4-phosphate dehydrogenase PdxA [Methylobacteriaceae bacterium]|jgi:4-hydroxythreonine-4-phosphate dehydrogenase|nr:4-hydroxythreonine-4-phosphate dehydrogenase PdxA [Methylobacteriaceae bacterium]
MSNIKPIIAILLGDASGCGPEIIAKLAAAGKLAAGCRPVLIGDTRVFANAQTYAATNVPVAVISAVSEADWGGPVPFIDLKNLDPATFQLAKPNAECGRAMGESFLKALELAVNGDVHGIMYAPAHKAALNMGGFHYDSEAELFASVLDVRTYHNEINILYDVWTTRVTSHVPLKDVSGLLTRERVVEAIVFADTTLKKAGYEKPRVAVAAFNPHAGENGKFGTEEIEVIGPAVETAAAQGIDATGPYPADTIFDRAFKGQFDMVVTLFHDQGQIALKTKGFSEGVTVAGGMPVPICTPAHGTAFGKVGKGTADTKATENALRICCRMSVQALREKG